MVATQRVVAVAFIFVSQCVNEQIAHDEPIRRTRMTRKWRSQWKTRTGRRSSTSPEPSQLEELPTATATRTPIRPETTGGSGGAEPSRKALGNCVADGKQLVGGCQRPHQAARKSVLEHPVNGFSISLYLLSLSIKKFSSFGCK